MYLSRNLNLWSPRPKPLNRLIAASTTGSPPEDFWEAVEGQQEWIVDNDDSQILSNDVVVALEAKLTSSANSKGSKTAEFALADPKDALLRSNHRPSLMQGNILRAILAQKTAEITDVDHEILGLQLKVNDMMGKMKTLEESRSRRKEGANFYRFLLSPIRLLPPELLIRIFKFTLSPECYRPSRSTSSPLGLSQVCSAWRSAVLGCSSFWNALELQPSRFVPGGFFKRPLGTINTLTTSWFNRANSSRPLLLSLVIDGAANVLVSDAKDELIQSIRCFSTRFSELSIRLSIHDYDALEPFLTLPGGSLPTLETLNLVTVEDSVSRDSFDRTRQVPQRENPELPPIAVFEAAPRLRKAHLRVPSLLLVDGLRLRLPWGQLNHLEITGKITLQAFVKVIFQCPQLHTVSFNMVNLQDTSDPNEPFEPPNPVTFSHLEAFKLRLAGKDEVFDITDSFSMIHLPKVQTLELAGDFVFEGFPLFSLLPGISNPSLIRCLRLAEMEAEVDEIIQLVSACTMLEHLTLFVPDVSAKLLLERLSLLTSGDASDVGPLLSQLTSFSFTFRRHDTDGPDIIGEAFGDLVASWIKDLSCQRPLESLSLYILDNAFAGRGDDTIERMFERVRTDLRNAEKVAGRSDEIVLNTDLFNFFSRYLAVLGFPDSS